MILDQPLDPKAVQQLSAADKVKLLKTAYLEALQFIEQAQQQKYQVLKQTSQTVDQTNIQSIKRTIATL